jgi:hypothetical protein
MAKGRKGKSGKSQPEAPGAAPERDGAPLDKAAAKAAARADRGLRKHLKRLQRRLVDAARTEAKRVRKLERARWRRQRLEAAVDEARTASSVGPSEAAPKAKAEAAPRAAADAKPKAEPKPKMEALEAYCLREKRRVQMVDPKPVVTANGGSALSGTCPSCGASLYKLVGRTAH